MNLKHKLIIELHNLGLTTSEIRNLEWSHVDRRGRCIYILNEKFRIQRSVKFGKNFLTLLEDYFIEYTPEIYVLEGAKSKQITMRMVQLIIKK